MDGFFQHLHFEGRVVQLVALSKIRAVDVPSHCFLATILVVSVFLFVSNALAVSRVSFQFHGLGKDLLVGVCISRTACTLHAHVACRCSSSALQIRPRLGGFFGF